jgi:RHS repeat-associated protein
MYDASGALVWSGTIDAYGDLRAVRGDRYACPFRWPGQYEDAETGLYYNRFRYYDPSSGRYVSQDPIRLEGGLRAHGYVRDPLSGTDPLGLTGCGSDPVETPYGPAEQGTSPAALAARQQVEEGATLYRLGTLGKSEADSPQFWALEHPLSPGYADRYGIPQENVERANFIETAVVPPGTPFVTREAPGVGGNKGGGIEVVTPPGGAKLQSFSTKGDGW